MYLKKPAFTCKARSNQLCARFNYMCHTYVLIGYLITCDEVTLTTNVFLKLHKENRKL